MNASFDGIILGTGRNALILPGGIVRLRHTAYSPFYHYELPSWSGTEVEQEPFLSSSAFRKMNDTIKIALVGAGMFGGDVHLRAYADLQRFGIAGQLARVGLDQYSRDLAAVNFELVAVATRSQKSAKRACAQFNILTQDSGEAEGKRSRPSRTTDHGSRITDQVTRPYFGDTPWLDILRDFPYLDVLAVANPDHLHT